MSSIICVSARARPPGSTRPDPRHVPARHCGGRYLFTRSLRAARKRAGLTQADVADALSISKEVYARYESARVWPSIGTFQKLCGVLGCPADVLLGLREVEAGMAPPPPSDPPPVRRLLRELRRARANTRRVVAWFLAEMEKRGGR